MSEARKELLSLLQARGLPRPGNPFPLATLEEFFHGNEDESSIGARLEDHPGLKHFYEHLVELRARPEVQDVLVEISEVCDPDDAGSEAWPVSEQIYVLSSAEREELEDWLEELDPSAIVEGHHGDLPKQAPALVPGMRVWGVWWD